MLLAHYVGLRFKEASLFRPHRDFDGQRIWVKGLERPRAAALVAREVGHSRTEVLDWYLADAA